MNRSMEQRDAEVKKTMNILDEMPRIEAHHLFRARLLQRIEASAQTASTSAGFNPRLAFFSLLLLFNIAMGVLLFLHQDPQMTNRSSAIAESYNEEYGSPALSYYEQPVADQTGNE
ncbi:MAG: hypothetical protein HGB29_06575 [Chlorobiaceae bacterium]|nr:hypothetical protein [Chlorobiaceae bacterium]NTW74511.1 hypothetical protein [Chlorobiaceae bacterium]